MGDDTTIHLTGGLNVQAIASACETLRVGLAQARGHVTLDLSQIEAFDSAGAQLLLAARRTLAERGCVLRLVAPAPVVVEAVKTLGLHGLLPVEPCAVSKAAPAGEGA